MSCVYDLAAPTRRPLYIESSKSYRYIVPRSISESGARPTHGSTWDRRPRPFANQEDERTSLRFDRSPRLPRAHAPREQLRRELARPVWPRSTPAASRFKCNDEPRQVCKGDSLCSLSTTSVPLGRMDSLCIRQPPPACVRAAVCKRAHAPRCSASRAPKGTAGADC